MKRQIRLAHKLILLVILTTGLAVTVPSMLVIRRGTQALQQQKAELMLSVARRSALLVELSLKDDGRELLALRDELADAGDRLAAREVAVRRWFERNEDALEVGCLSQGPRAPWAAVRRQPIAAEPIDIGQPLAELADYGLIAVGVEHGDDGAHGLIIATKPTGANPVQLVSKWRLAEYSDLLRQVRVGRTGYPFLVDRRGHLLAHPDYRAAVRPGAAPPHAALGRSLADLDMVKDVLAPGSPGRLFYTSETGDQVIATGVTIPGLGWAVVTRQSQREAMAALRTMEQQVLLWGSTTGLVAILLGLAIVRQITRPVESLVEAANRVGEGDLTHPVGVATRDEIGQLALAFNEMQIRLREMYDKLERMVTERTHELQQTTDFLNSVLDSSTEYSIIATDLNGMILSYNEGSRRTYGYEPEEILGAPDTILTPPDGEDRRRFEDILRQVRREGSFAGDLERVRKGGRRFPARLVMTLRYDDTGKPIGFTTVSRDIADRRQLEAKVREYTENLETLVASKTRELQAANLQLERANRLKAEFLASMSHELRTPLNAILGFGDVLREEISGPLNDQQKQFVADILNSGRQLLNLINDILDLSKVDAGRMELSVEDVELAVLFDEVKTIIQGMAVRKGLSLAFTEDPPGTWVRADRVKVLQILYNLLSNAVKFTPPGGSVRVEAEHRDHDVRFRVIDTGVGIPEESLELIFEEFRQVDSRLSREYGGTGLGLALTRKLVTLHGGTLTVQSQVGKGSVFTFTIPHILPIDGPQPAAAGVGR